MRAAIIGGLAVALVAGLPGVGFADDVEAQRVALLRLDSLGMDEERVSRLETLFRVEIDRLTPKRSPSALKIRRLMAKPEHAECGGESACLAAIGKALGADVVVTGNVAALADAFVVNIKAVAVDGSEVGRVTSEPLRGNPDELIESVRVSAYRLLAPSKLLGAIRIVADIDGAEVLIDGNKVATTPLVEPIKNLAVGDRRVEVRANGFKGFTQTVNVEFQKTSQIVVTLVGENPTGGRVVVTPPPKSKPFYKRGWFWAAVGVAAGAIVVGAVIGNELSKPEIVMCTGDGECD